MRNHLRGKVCRIVPTRQAYFVAVDIGQILWAEVTSQAAAELELQPGAEVVCLVKANSWRPWSNVGQIADLPGIQADWQSAPRWRLANT